MNHSQRRNKTPPEQLTDALQAMQENDFDSAIKRAHLHIAATDPELLYFANRLTALAYFKKEFYAQATSYFKFAAQDSTSSQDWFDIVTPALYSNEPELARQAFEKAVDLRIQSSALSDQEPTPQLMALYYSYSLCRSGNYRRAFDLINELRDIYENLNVTDDTFLYIRGVPMLHDYVSVAGNVLFHLSDQIDVGEWISSFSKKLDSDGQEILSRISLKPVPPLTSPLSPHEANTTISGSHQDDGDGTS